jgi:hypothetical protein
VSDVKVANSGLTCSTPGVTAGVPVRDCRQACISVGPDMPLHNDVEQANGPILTLSFRSSTMLRIGAGVRAFGGGKDNLNPWSLACPGKTSGNGNSERTSGVGGCDSPNTTVLGRKRDAITTRWFLSELIVRTCGKKQGEGSV